MDGRWRELLAGPGPVLALAPMQDVTDAAFWRVFARYGGADVYFTEYFRVHAVSRLDRSIVEAIVGNPTGRPVVAQAIGNDVPALVRTARELQQLPVAGVDLNLGCPAPIVYRKCAGGGLLRDLNRVDAIVGALREAVTGVPFSVKTRIGFDSAAGFDDLLRLLARHRPDAVTVHARTVSQVMGGPVRYDLIGRAAGALPCPVLANGSVHSAAQARALMADTGARGVMVGRGAVRNPWLFRQIREELRGEPAFVPRGRDVLAYLRALYEGLRTPGCPERVQVHRIKKHLRFVGCGIDPAGRFLHQARRATSEAELFAAWEAFLDHDEPMALTPFGAE